MQAFALKQVLVARGHEVIFINRRRNRPNSLKNRLHRLLASWNIIEDKVASRTNEISIYTNQFKRKYLEPITKEYYTTKQLKTCLKLGLDCIVVGSDQVWRYRYAKDSIDDFFCNFAIEKNIPCFSYAASMGTDIMEYPQEKVKICARLLECFKSVSVRERSSVNLLRDFFCAKDVHVVLDPTLLLDRQVYMNLFKSSYSDSVEPYIFTYILDYNEETGRAIKKISKQKKKDIVDVKAQTIDINKIEYIEPVEKWLSSICYSDYVITDSFHGTVFSIIFHKQFVVVNNAARGSARLSYLLTQLHLENRIINTVSDMGETLNNPIDWSQVDAILQTEKEKSYYFLDNSLQHIIR